jgi:hypothetical protein
VKKRIACHRPEKLGRESPAAAVEILQKAFGGPLNRELPSVPGTGSSSRRHRVDIHPATITVESDLPIDQRENCEIAPQSDVPAGQKFRPALADNNVSGNHLLAAEFFDPETLADAIAAVLDRSLSFFVSHNESRLRIRD